MDDFSKSIFKELAEDGKREHMVEYNNNIRTTAHAKKMSCCTTPIEPPSPPFPLKKLLRVLLPERAIVSRIV